MLDVAQDFRTEQNWTNSELGTHWNTAIHKDGYFYGFDGHFEQDAALVCVDARTGKTIWREEPQWEETIVLNGEKTSVALSTFRGSLLWVDGHFLCLGEFGHLLWMDLSPQGYKILQRVWLFSAQETWGLPVLSRGLLYICQNSRDTLNRTPKRLLCYDFRAGSAEPQRTP